MELNERERENLVNLLSSSTDKDVELGFNIILELNTSEEEYLKIMESASDIMEKTMNKRWKTDECILIYKNLKKQKHG